jgi:hypothetical protein
MADLFSSMKTGLTPEIIKGKLFSFHEIAHSLHLDTKSDEEHRALGSLYEGLADFKDDIPEKLMGYLGGKRIGQCKLGPLPMYSPTASSVLCREILDFAKELSEYAKKNYFLDIDNIAAALSGLAAKTIYRLSLT